MAWSIERGRRKREDERRFDKEVRQLCVELALAVRDVHMPEDHMGPSPLATDHEEAWRLTATLLEMELIAPKDLHEAAANAYLSATAGKGATGRKDAFYKDVVTYHAVMAKHFKRS